MAHGYGVFAPGQEAAALAALRAGISAKGYAYMSDGDARSYNNAHADGMLWDLPGEPMQGLQNLLAVRKAALGYFAAGALPPDRQLGDAERRLVPIYLLHRYQAEAVARLLGGSSYAYGLIGDTAPDTVPVAADRQRRGLGRIARHAQPRHPAAAGIGAARDGAAVQ